MPTYLGLDCGGSSCRALALDETGEPVFLAQGGSANLASTPETTLDRSLRRALEGLPQVDYVCACFAGLINEERRTKAEALIRQHVPNVPLRLEPDFAAALRAVPDGCMSCVVAGTGSIVCSRLENGTLVRSGGGGYVLGDEGSGFRYGRAGLRHYLRQPDHVSDAMKEAIERLFHTLDPSTVVASVYTASSPAALVAGVAAAVFRDAEARRPYALQAVQEECEALADIVAGHLRRFHPDHAEPWVGLAGSIWKKRLVRDTFEACLQREVEGARAIKSEMPPARGAALLAMEMEHPS